MDKVSSYFMRFIFSVYVDSHSYLRCTRKKINEIALGPNIPRNYVKKSQI